MEQKEPRYSINKDTGLEVLQSIWDMIEDGDLIEIVDEKPAHNFTVIQGGSNGSNS